MVNLDLQVDREAPVLVVGAAGVDLVGRLVSDLQPGTSSPARIRSSFGGSARNVAENIARLGHEVVLLTAVGDDEVGERLLQQASAAGVDTSRVKCCQDQPTGTYLAVIDLKGDLAFALDDMEVIRTVTSEYLREQEEAFKNASLLFIDMNLEPKALRTAFSLARKAKLPVFSDPTSVNLGKRMLPYLNRMLFISPNSTEAAMLCDFAKVPRDYEEALNAASCLLGKGVEIVVITLAEFGLCYATAESRGSIPAVATEILDPTGAGDALTAAVIFALLNDIPLDEAMRLGVSAASLTLRYPGAVHPEMSLENLYNRLVI